MERGHPSFRDRITLWTYHKLALFRPKELMETIAGVPVMMIIPELVDISSLAEQQEAFDRLRTPKRLYLARGKGNLSIMTGNGSVELFQATAVLYRAMLEGKIVQKKHRIETWSRKYRLIYYMLLWSNKLGNNCRTSGGQQL